MPFQALIGILQTYFIPCKVRLRPWVSSPYRYSSNEPHAVREVARRVVSSPYRYSSNEIVADLVSVLDEVSSPYRYSSNPEGRDRIRPRTCRFQALIGILQTQPRRQPLQLFPEFQALIGILQTFRPGGLETGWKFPPSPRIVTRISSYYRMYHHPVIFRGFRKPSPIFTSTYF